MSGFVTAYDQRDGEEHRVRGWQLEQFLKLGYSVDVAEKLLEAHADYHVIEKLTADGCPRELAARIAG